MNFDFILTTKFSAFATAK